MPDDTGRISPLADTFGGNAGGSKKPIEAWKAYDLLMASARVGFIQEADSDALEEEFRAVTMTGNFAHKQWPDAYLAAFAKTSNLTLVTFDNALYKLAGDDVLILHGRTQ